MSAHHFDLAVAYRIYPGISKEPAVHADDKVRLAELCLRSFKEAVGTLRVKVWALLDGCPPEYEAMFRRHFAPDQLQIIALDGEGNLPTFARQIRLLLDQDEAENVYFAEDDYLYMPGALQRMVDLLASVDGGAFVSAYDHPDHYHWPIHQNPYSLRVHDGHHWRQADSTCLTFMTTRTTLRRTERIFSSYCDGNHDLTLWLALTKYVVRQPLRLLGLLARDRLMFRLVADAWRYFPWETAFAHRWPLWVPVPSLATHVEITGLAPGVAWEDRIRQLEESGSATPAQPREAPPADGAVSPQQIRRER